VLPRAAPCDSFQETWANAFPDEQATGDLLDVLYNGMLVERVHYVVVDGGRALLPIPDRNEADDGTITWTVSRDEADLIRVLDEMERQPGNFADYLGRADISVAG
jgi:hypothetical protein